MSSIITSGNVTSGKSDNQLLALAAFSPGFGHDVLIKSLHGPLEAGEFHHSVRDLTAPQGRQRLVKPVQAFSGVDLGRGFPEGSGEGTYGAGLNAHLDRLHRRESNVSEEFGGGGGRQVQRCSVQIGIFFAQHSTVNVLEHFIEAKLADT